MVGPPVLSVIKKNQELIPIVIAFSKTGHIIVADRNNGKLIYGYEFEKVKQSELEGERLANYQKLISRPTPISDTYFNMANDITGISSEKKNTFCIKLEMQNSGNMFRYLQIMK